MAKKSKAAEPVVRKSFLVFGGIVVGVAVLGFVVSTFVLGGGGGGGGEDIETPSSSAAPAASSNPAAVPGSDGVPATGGVDANKFPANQLTPGGKNPFSPRAGGTTSSAASTSSTPAVVETAVEAAKPHTWQMLDLASGKATILVDGKKKIVGVGDKVIDGYTFNSVTGKCVTVKGPTIFGLCQGAAPITQ